VVGVEDDQGGHPDQVHPHLAGPFLQPARIGPAVLVHALAPGFLTGLHDDTSGDGCRASRIYRGVGPVIIRAGSIATSPKRKRGPFPRWRFGLVSSSPRWRFGLVSDRAAPGIFPCRTGDTEAS